MGSKKRAIQEKKDMLISKLDDCLDPFTVDSISTKITNGRYMLL